MSAGERKPLEGEERRAAMEELLERGWQAVEDRDAVRKTYEFGSFVRAWQWMSAVALAAEKANHHPEWCNCYGRVEVTLSSHDAGGITERDVALARRMDRLAKED